MSAAVDAGARLRAEARRWRRFHRCSCGRPMHGVISVESPRHVRWAEAYVTALREMAPRCDLPRLVVFVGSHDTNRLHDAQPAERAATLGVPSGTD